MMTWNITRLVESLITVRVENCRQLN